MVDVSIVEFAVYGLVAYTSLVILLLTMLVAPPASKKGTIARSIYMLTGVIFCFVIASVGPTISMPLEVSSLVITTANTTTTHAGNATSTITIMNGPVWTYGHTLLGILMLVYVLQELVTLFTKVD